MKSGKLPLTKIEVADSKYRFCRKATLDDADRRFELLDVSFSASGILSPIIVHETGEGAYHLVDGFYRVLWAMKEKEEEVDAAVIRPDAPVESVIMVALGQVITADISFGKKAKLVNIAQNLAAKEDVLIKTILPALGFEPHKNVLKNIEKAATLPDDVFDFCSDKNFSMKQVMAIARRDRKLVAMVFSWRDKINLTARNFEAMTEQISDISRSGKYDLEGFTGRDDINDALNSGASIHERTERLKNIMEQIYRPTLSAVNEEIEDAASSAALPGGAEISWDRTLEKREVNVKITASDKDEYLATATALASEKAVNAIERIIDKL